MKFNLLFLLMASMLCLHPHLRFIIGLFPSCDPLTHEYQGDRVFISWIGANRTTF